MKKILPLLLLHLLLLPLILFGQTTPTSKHFKLPARVSSKDYLPNTIVIKFKELPDDNKNAIETFVKQSFTKKYLTINTTRQLFPSSASTTNTTTIDNSSMGLDHIVEVTYSSENDIESVINEILKNNNVEYAEPQYIYQSKSIPNDLLYLGGNQSYLNATNTPSAWNIAITSSTPTIIAIVDSGSQLDHPDLAANIYHNEADPINNNDDDGDGYIDNYNGWDFVGAYKSNPIGDRDPNVVNSAAAHGVHISGLASAVTNNTTGIASVAYNTAKLLIIKASGDDYPKDVIKGYEGIKYAVDHGAKIINCSWGGAYSSAYGQNIVNYAIGRDCLIVAATGNNLIGRASIDFPAAYPGVLAVTSISDANRLSTFANYGPEVGVSAPGENIVSTWYNDVYYTDKGTSMSAAIVSSAAALIKSTFPTWTMQQVAEQIKNTADNIDANNPGKGGLIGKGKLNVYRAIASAIPPNTNTPNTTLRLSQNFPNPSNSTTTIQFDVPEDAQSSLTLYSILGQAVKQYFNTYLYKGPQSFSIDVSSIAPGLYIYQVRCGNIIESLKMLID